MRQSFMSAITFAVVLAGKSLANPVVERASEGQITDTVILNYALTLEHLENNFYQGALARFSENDFKKAGFAPWVRSRFQQISDHEKTHVAFLSSALGKQAVQPCTYKFPYTDPRSFAALSGILEGVGVSAYTGAAQFIENDQYLTAAASILATEARHAAFVTHKTSPWGTAFETPLGLNQVYTLAAQFIVSCPASNPTLPVTAFPKLALSSAGPGETATVTSAGKTAPSYIAFFTGLDQIFVPVKNNQVVIPTGLMGQVYAIATNSNSPVTDATTVSGPAVLRFDRDSKNKLTNHS